MSDTMKMQLHTPPKLAAHRADVIVNAFGVEVAETASVDHAMPIVLAVNAHDDMLAALKALREWAVAMGGWDAPCWAQAEVAILRAEGKL